MARYRFKEMRDAVGVTLEDLAAGTDISVSQLSRFETGKREPRLDDLLRVANFLRQPWQSFVDADDGPIGSIVPVVGLIGAGGQVETSVEQLEDGDNLFEVEVPFAVPPDAMAFEIRGESMWPRYDSGDVIICHRHSIDPSSLLGWEAAVGTPDGNRYLKKLMAGGKKGLFTLESHNAAPIRDVRISWASDVSLVVRASQVRHMTKNGKRRLEKKIDDPPL